MSQYSPLLAIITGSFELLAALYFFILFKNREINTGIKPLITILFFLSGYQLMEAANCVFPGNPMLVRFSFADITWLPALGVYYAYKINNSEKKSYKRISFLFTSSAIFFTGWFIMNPVSVTLKSCQAFFATYTNEFPIFQYYGIYYQLGMLFMVIFSVQALVTTENIRERMIISDFVIGSLMFVIPSLTVTAFYAKFRGSMPSVMCHFALFLGVFIVKSLIREQKYENISVYDVFPINP